MYFIKVSKDYTSQTCPMCDAHTGKKELSHRIHSCPECGYITSRDVAAAQVIRNRGETALREGFPPEPDGLQWGEVSSPPSPPLQAGLPPEVTGVQATANPKGVLAVGRIVGEENACGDGLTGTGNSGAGDAPPPV